MAFANRQKDEQERFTKGFRYKYHNNGETCKGQSVTTDVLLKITPKDRIEKQMVDRTALREAVINAIVHNDYSRSAVPTIEVFSDRITIASYGGLPEGLSRESFFECCSMPRNRELMRVFNDVGLVEQLGSGMGRILNAYDRSVFKFAGDFLIVSFPFAEGFDIAINDINDIRVVSVVNDVANIILDAFKSNPRAIIKEVAKMAGVTSRTIDREVELLKIEGKLKRVGSSRSGNWEVYEICTENRDWDD